MATPKTKISPKEIEELSWKYILECESNLKDHPTSTGKAIKIKDRHIPTINYFLKIWVPSKGKNTIARSTYYRWLNGENEEKSDTIKNIEGVFKALAVDIVPMRVKEYSMLKIS